MSDPTRLSTGLLIAAVMADAGASELNLEMADRLLGQQHEISLLQADVMVERSARMALESRLLLANIALNKLRPAAGNDEAEQLQATG